MRKSIFTLLFLFAFLEVNAPIYGENSFINKLDELDHHSTKAGKGLQATLVLDGVVNNPDASVTYTVTATLTNNSKQPIGNISYVDQFLNLYQVTLNSVTVTNLVQANPLPSLENKILDFINDFFPNSYQVTTKNCAHLAKSELQYMIDTQSLLALTSSLLPGQSGSLTYTFTYFPLVDAPSSPLESIAFVRGDASGEHFKVKSTLPLGLSPVALPLNPRIGIVGAGLAGLTVAYRLVQAGYTPIIYEGSDRIGGRAFSGVLLEDQVFEHGGEFIDTDQTDIMELAGELGLVIDDLYAGQTPGTVDIYQVIDYDVCPPKKIPYSIQEATNDYFNTFNPQTGLSIFQELVNLANDTYPTNSPPPGPATPWPLTYGDPALAIQLDSMNLNDYIDQLTAFLRPDQNGSKTKLAQFLKTAYVQEYGAEPDQQSPFNLIYLLGFQTLPPGVEPPNVPPSYFQPYGISDQRYHIQGGSAELALALVEVLQQNQVTIYKKCRLTKIKYQGGPYQLSFVSSHKDSFTPPNFDHIVLALPFATMHPTYSKNGKLLYDGQFVDYSEANFSDLKKYAIQYLAISRTSKMNVQFKNRFWRDEGYDGNTYVTSNPYVNGKQGLEKTYQNSWEVTRAQPGIRGILTAYTGGNKSQEYRTSYILKDPEKKNRILKVENNSFLHQLDFLYHGATSTKNFCYVYGCQFPFKILDEKPFPFFPCFFTANNEAEFSLCTEKEEKSIINVICDNWTESPWQRGAYAYWSPGQYIAGQGQIINGVVEPPGAVVPFAGFEGVSEPYTPAQTGTCHFAGEHTSYDNQGYMDGAVESGNRVAAEILSEI